MTARSDGLPIPQRYWAMVAVATGVTMSALDASVANIALPTITRDLHAAPADTVWVIRAYQITIVMFLLPLASLGERAGYRRVYQTGLAIFTAASLACALSTSLTGLVLARIAQGVGAAGVMSMNGALIRLIYPKASLGRGMGLNAMTVATALTLGPTIAGAVLAVGRWEWLFAINVPIGVVNFILASRVLPESDRSTAPFDWVSGGLNAVVFCLIFVGVDAFGHGHGEGWAIGILYVVALVATVVALVRRETSRDRPLVPVDLMREPVFSLSAAASVLSAATYTLAFVSLPFFFESVQHRGQFETGLLMSSWPIGSGLAATVSGRLSDRFPAGILGGIGMLVLTGGLTLLVFLPQDATAAALVWRIGLCGLGYGMFQAPNNRMLLGAAPRERAGAASGVLAAARLTGLSLGSTAAATVFRLASHEAESVALALGAGLALAAAGASVARLAR